MPTQPAVEPSEAATLPSAELSRSRFERPLALAGLLLLGVLLYGPWLSPGYLLGYDWTSGPHTKLPPAIYGLGQGRASIAPLLWAIEVLRHLTFGVDPVAIALALGPLILGFGMERVIGKTPFAWFAAAAFAAVNPFVQQRLGTMAFGLVLALNLLPFVVAAARDVASARWEAGLLLGLLLAVGTALSPQFLPLGAFAAVVMVVLFLWRGGASLLRRSLLACAVAGGTFVLASAYWIVSVLVNGFPSYQRIGSGDLATFATRPDRQLGLFPNILGLYGFWRPVAPTTKNIIGSWWSLLVVIEFIVCIGLVALRRSSQRRLLWCLVAIGGAGVFIAAGSQGPTGPLFRFAYDAVPGFKMFREPEKALILLTFAYAVLFGVGAASLVRSVPRPFVRAIFAVVILAVPMLYGLSEFWGVRGYLAPSQFPRSWNEAAAITKTQPGTILFLPWHQFQRFEFTKGRVIANPAPDFFSSPVIVNDDDEIPSLGFDGTDPRDQAVMRFLREGPVNSDAATVLTSLGVRWIFVDDSTFPGGLSWLLHQSNLAVRLNSDHTYLLQNLDWSGTAYLTSREGSTLPTPVRGASPVALRLDVPIPPGATLTLAKPYDPGWSLSGISPRRNASGTITFGPVAAGLPAGAEISFRPWQWSRLAVAVSVMTVGMVLVALTFARVRDLSEGRFGNDGTSPASDVAATPVRSLA